MMCFFFLLCACLDNSLFNLRLFFFFFVAPFWKTEGVFLISPSVVGENEDYCHKDYLSSYP